MKADTRVHECKHYVILPLCERTKRCRLLKRLPLPSVAPQGHPLLREGSPDSNQTESPSEILTQCCPPVGTGSPSLLLAYHTPPGCRKAVRESDTPQKPLDPTPCFLTGGAAAFCSLGPILARATEERRHKERKTLM